MINEAVGAVPDGGEKFGAQNSDDQFWSYLIKEVRKQLCVWKREHRGFKNNAMRNRTLSKTAEALNVKGNIFNVLIFASQLLATDLNSYVEQYIIARPN